MKLDIFAWLFVATQITGCGDLIKNSVDKPAATKEETHALETHTGS